MDNNIINEINILLLVAIYKSLSGTINICGNECPENCTIIVICEII